MPRLGSASGQLQAPAHRSWPVANRKTSWLLLLACQGKTENLDVVLVLMLLGLGPGEGSATTRVSQRDEVQERRWVLERPVWTVWWTWIRINAQLIDTEGWSPASAPSDPGRALAGRAWRMNSRSGPAPASTSA